MSETGRPLVAGGVRRSDRKRVGDKAITAAPGGDVLERVLASLLDLSFVLTDREGLVTRWTSRTERLFGRKAADAAGRPLLECVGASEDEAPAAGRVQLTARHPEGGEFETELTFIPVPMSHSLEFNGFLESLESNRPTESVMRRVNSQHSDVLDWIGSVVTDGVPLHSDELTAGTIVAFRPLGDVPWLAAAPPEAGPVTDEAGLGNAVDRAAEVLARSDALERTLDEAGVAVEEARAMADAAHEEATGAARRVSELAGENEDLRTELERAHSELGELRTTVESAPSPVSSDEVARIRSELEAMRSAPPAVTREDLEVLRAELREMRGDATGGGEAARRAEEVLETVRSLADELRLEVQEARDAATVEAKVARVQAEAARVHSEEAGTHAQSARDVAEAWASAAERHRGRPEENGRAEAPSRPEKPQKQRTPAREARPGFDDADRPMAVIGLEGRFRELNPKFTELVGYSEPDFQSASWPPVADRAQLDHHREQMRALVDGETDSVEVDTSYVHAQGLMVPIAGTLSIERDDHGEPSRFLLSVQAPAAALSS
jgi:PAS domain S-box-containing protein